MYKQQTLFGLSKTSEEDLKQDHRGINPVDEASQHQQHPIKKQTELVYSISAIADSKLDGVNVSFNLSTSFEIVPYPQKYSTYGGYWGGNSFNADQANELLRDLIESRRAHMRKPYVDELEDAHLFTDLKADNITIEIDSFTLHQIEKHAGKPWKAFLDEFNSIGNTKSTPDDISFGHELRLLEKDLEAARRKRDAARKEMDSFFEQRPGFFGQKNPDDVYKKWTLHAAECGAMEDKLEKMNREVREYGIV